MANLKPKRECEGCGTTVNLWKLVNGQDVQRFCWHCIKLEFGELLEGNDEISASVNQDERTVTLL